MNTVKVFRKEGVFILDLYGYVLYNLFKWSVNPAGYLVRGHNKKPQFFHRDLLKAGHGTLIDHINQNSKDNRLFNLRFSDKSKNAINTPPRAGRKYKGIKAVKQKYVARIRANGVNFNLGTYATAKEAAQAYNKAVLLHYGDFAWLNPIE